ncbi:MAG: efflux RND transporter periplasmic adaptor subunit [Arcobacter sp.]|uniref:efflux RND transporter periplasmic adaptor subunit n=1 Tax=Arcobacter sp. TaxID=1872629 RepID=UPI003B0075C6
MRNIQKLFLLLLFMGLLNAQILEVNQLFNKKVVKVKDETIYETKSFYGETLFAEDSIKDIVLRFDGYVSSIAANKNLMEVKKGDKLFSLYSDEIESIKKEIEVTKSINKALYKSSLDKLDSLDVKLSQIKNKDVSFYAPFNGIILNKKINDGSYVKTGTLLMQLANIDRVWFISKVYQSDLEFLSNDMEAKIKIDGIDMSFKTKVDYIYPIANNKSKTIDVRFVIDNKNKKLFPNMFGKALIKSSSKKMLTLPKTAVLAKGDKYYVFKPISKDEFEPVLVVARRISSSKYEIEDGLSAGDEVINNALFLLDSDAVTNNLYDSDSDDDW